MNTGSLKTRGRKPWVFQVKGWIIRLPYRDTALRKRLMNIAIRNVKSLISKTDDVTQDFKSMKIGIAAIAE